MLAMNVACMNGHSTEVLHIPNWYHTQQPAHDIPISLVYFGIRAPWKYGQFVVDAAAQDLQLTF